MSKNQQQREAIIIINSLPDSILCHVLSFLPTKQAVAASILSKRWKPLWLSVLTLNFIDHSRFIKTNDILSQMYSVMLSRHNTLPIQFFSLKCCPKDNSDDLNDVIELVSTAIQRKTQTLHLDLSYYVLDMKLASNIFTCRTLTVLKLQKLTIRDLPPINNDKKIISPIKTLHLDTVFVIDRRHLMNFLLLFPNLEELQTNLIGHMRKRKRFPRPRFVPTTEDKIKCLPNLVTAKLSDNESIPLFFLSRALTTLTIKLVVEYLRPVDVPIFDNLTQMEIFFHKNNWPKQWIWILEMLQHSPKLQYLIIHDKEKVNPKVVEVDEWEDPKIVPECLSSHLKTFLYSNYRGNECEFEFTQYVMRNSKVLSKMTIQCASSIDLNAKYQMLKKLSVSPRSGELIFE